MIIHLYHPPPELFIKYYFTMSIKTIEQLAAVVPYGDALLHKVEEVYQFSKEKTTLAYTTTKGRINSTQKEYQSFKKNAQTALLNITEETVNEILTRCESLVKINRDSDSERGLKVARQRLQSIVLTLYHSYLLKNPRIEGLVKLGGQYSAKYLVPMYISLKATLIVAKEMLIQFLQSFLKEAKLTYECSRDHVVMFVAGNFNQEKLKKTVLEGIDSFKDFTIKIVNKGLEIKVDRKSLVENYDQFAVKFLEVVKEIRDKGEDNVTQIKKKSRDLYKEVVNRIRAKELQIKTNKKSLASGIQSD